MTGAVGTTADSEMRARLFAELERVVALGLSDSSERQKQLLRFLVTEEIEGRGDRLKAYAIATRVFDRPADFDAQQDAIVRVEVGRLRKSLDLYFATSGAADDIRVVIDKGGYRPRFEFRAEVATQTPQSGETHRPRRSPKTRWPTLAAVAVACVILGLWGWRYFVQPTRAGPRIAVAPFTLSADRDGQN